MNRNVIPNSAYIDEAVRELIRQWSAPGQPKYDLIDLAARIVRNGYMYPQGNNRYKIGTESRAAQPEITSALSCSCSLGNLQTPCVHKLAVLILEMTAKSNTIQVIPLTRIISKVSANT